MVKIGIAGIGFVGNAVKTFFEKYENIIAYDKYKDFERQINEAKKQIEKEADMNQYLKRYGM